MDFKRELTVDPAQMVSKPQTLIASIGMLIEV